MESAQDLVLVLAPALDLVQESAQAPALESVLVLA